MAKSKSWITWFSGLHRDRWHKIGKRWIPSVCSSASWIFRAANRINTVAPSGQGRTTVNDVVTPSMLITKTITLQMYATVRDAPLLVPLDSARSTEKWKRLELILWRIGIEKNRHYIHRRFLFPFLSISWWSDTRIETEKNSIPILFSSRSSKYRFESIPLSRFHESRRF